jgi:hypothetical protein
MNYEDASEANATPYERIDWKYIPTSCDAVLSELIKALHTKDKN